MDPALVGVISACTALVASIVGPIVTLAVARRQFNATVLSANRQKWIEALRDGLAELISLLVTALVVKEKWKTRWDGGRGPLAEDSALLDKLERIVLAQSKIRLLLNPAEPDHVRLVQAIDAAFTRLQAQETSDADTEADIKLITSIAQSILRHEWQRVKSGA